MGYATKYYKSSPQRTNVASKLSRHSHSLGGIKIKKERKKRTAVLLEKNGFWMVVSKLVSVLIFIKLR